MKNAATATIGIEVQGKCHPINVFIISLSAKSLATKAHHAPKTVAIEKIILNMTFIFYC